MPNVKVTTPTRFLLGVIVTPLVLDAVAEVPLLAIKAQANTVVNGKLLTVQLVKSAVELAA